MTICVGFLMIASTGFATPSTPSTTSIKEILDVAVRQNSQISKAALDVSSAHANELQAAGLDDWRLSIATNASVFRKDLVQGQPVQLVENNTLNLSSQIARSISSGGTLALDISGSTEQRKSKVSLSDDQSDTSFDDFLDAPFESTTYNTSFSLSFTQPLLRGAGKTVARSEQQKALIDKNTALLQQTATNTEYIRRIILTYWELAYAIQEKAIQKASFDLALLQLKITNEAIAAGVVAPSERLAVEYTLAVKKESLLSAQIKINDRSLELRRLAGMEIGYNNITLMTSLPSMVVQAPKDTNVLLHRAHNKNPNLALSKNHLNETEIDMAVSKDATLPQLDLRASVTPLGFSENFKTAIERMGTFKDYQGTLSLTYSRSIENNYAEGVHKNAALRAHRRTLSFEETKREVSVSVIRTADTIRSAEKRFDIATTSIKLAQQNADIELNRFQNGSATNFDVLRRQEELEKAKLSRSRAVIDSLQATATLLALTGDLLLTYNIDILPTVTR